MVVRPVARAAPQERGQEGMFPNLVFVAPKFEAPNCAAFSGGEPHLTTAGNTAVAKLIGAACEPAIDLLG